MSENPKDRIGVTKARIDLVPPALVIEVAPVMALGAKKYGPHNWRQTDVRLTVYLTAIIRHALAALDGQWLDPESGRPHVAHIGAGAAIVLDANAIGRLDDDTVAGPAADLLAAQAPKAGKVTLSEDALRETTMKYVEAAKAGHASYEGYDSLRSPVDRLRGFADGPWGATPPMMDDDARWNRVAAPEDKLPMES